MENKDVNIILKLNTNIIIITVAICLLLSVLIFCSCYNLPISKKIRVILKKELMYSDVEPFSMPSMKEIKNAPKDFIKDLNSIIHKKNDKDHNKDHDDDDVKKKKEIKEAFFSRKRGRTRKPVVEGFFTNYGPN